MQTTQTSTADTSIANTKKVYLRTFGCQMNSYDSAKLTAYLTRHLGYSLTDNPQEADLAIFNTCHIREKADSKLYSDLGKLRPLYLEKKHRGEYLGIMVIGCIAQAEGEEILRQAPYVSAVVGPEAYAQLPEIIANLSTIAQQPAVTRTYLEFQPQTKFQLFDQIATPTFPYTSYVTIQEGCDKFCTYCVVPYTRGKEYSRPIADILAEIAQLEVPEITLLGQNVSAFQADYQGQRFNLADLIVKIADFPHIQRIRYTTSYPSEIGDDLITLHGSLAKLMPYLHLPVQSGSNTILAAMNRRHNREYYLELVHKLRQARPDLALSTDLIVGFPGETEQDFQDTLDLVQQVQFAQHFFFKYSKRYGTPAAAMANQVSEQLKSQRAVLLQRVLEQQQLAFNQNCIGKQLQVLIEDKARDTAQYLFGRSEYLQTVLVPEIPGKNLLGQIMPVTITEAKATELKGVICA